MAKENRRETRFVFDAQLRTISGDEAPLISGYAAVFDKMSDELPGGFREIIRPGTFTRTLKAGVDIRALVDHDPSKIIGRNKAGTLELTEDKTGLRVDIKPPDTQVGRDVVESLKRGDVDQMSFAFETVKDEWRTEDRLPIRELLDVDLFDVSVVTYPAYPDTSVGVRSLELFRAASPELQNAARLAKVADQRKRLDAVLTRGRIVE